MFTAFQLWILGGAIAGMFAIIMFLLGNSVLSAKDDRKKIFELIDKQENGLSNMKLDMVENYVKDSKLKEFEEKNEQAHKELRQDITRHMSKK